MKRLNKNHSGFTLIELIIVITIMLILSLIAVPGITGFMRDARTTEANSNAQLVLRGAQTWLNELEYNKTQIDPLSKGSIFKTDFSSGVITLTAKNTYNFTGTIPALSGWKDKDGNPVVSPIPASVSVDLTKYMSGLKGTKSGDDKGSMLVCIDLKTKSVKYAAWCADSTKDLSNTSVYLSPTATGHAITNLNKQEDFIKTNNFVIGVYPFNDEL